MFRLFTLTLVSKLSYPAPKTQNQEPKYIGNFSTFAGGNGSSIAFLKSLELDITSTYQRRQEAFSEKTQQLQKRYERLSLVRLAVFVAAILITIFLWSLSWVAVLFFIGVFIAAFYRFVVWHQAIQESARHHEELARINASEIDVLAHRYQQFPTGAHFLDMEHPYALDLDLFGDYSFFQYACRASTSIGQARLAGYLLHPLTRPERLLQRQAAIAELREQLEWRQHFQAYGREAKDDPLHLGLLHQWLEDPPFVANNRRLKLALYLAPLWFALGIFLWLTVLPWHIMLLIVAVPALIIRNTIERVNFTHRRTTHAGDTLALYGTLIRHIEGHTFQTPLLQELQQQFVQLGQPASHHIQQLAYIISQLNVRFNVFAIFLNIIGLWDLQWIYRLEKWKAELHDDLPRWFEALSEMEALSSMGNLWYNNPEWVMPEWSEAPQLEAVNIAHPLIKREVRVGNDLAMPTRGHIKLITGSNMAGKSTFLRTIGLNLVLAQAGAPVCAEKLKFPTVQVYTSMRTQDALHESTSSFYAELKRLKVIIEAVDDANQPDKIQLPVFFLLDEILKGTNSVDRHTGSAALIRQLIRQKGGGLIATHDLELGRLEAEAGGAIENLRIEVAIKDGELDFDYKLKKGVSESFNATLLMKRMGIRIDEE
jgi:Flp pilus assembly protein TadB